MRQDDPSTWKVRQSETSLSQNDPSGPTPWSPVQREDGTIGWETWDHLKRPSVFADCWSSFVSSRNFPILIRHLYGDGLIKVTFFSVLSLLAILMIASIILAITMPNTPLFIIPCSLAIIKFIAIVSLCISKRAQKPVRYGLALYNVAMAILCSFVQRDDECDDMRVNIDRAAFMIVAMIYPLLVSSTQIAMGLWAFTVAPMIVIPILEAVETPSAMIGQLRYTHSHHFSYWLVIALVVWLALSLICLISTMQRIIDESQREAVEAHVAKLMSTWRRRRSSSIVFSEGDSKHPLKILVFDESKSACAQAHMQLSKLGLPHMLLATKHEVIQSIRNHAGHQAIVLLLGLQKGGHAWISIQKTIQSQNLDVKIIGMVSEMCRVLSALMKKHGVTHFIQQPINLQCLREVIGASMPLHVLNIREQSVGDQGRESSLGPTTSNGSCVPSHSARKGSVLSTGSIVPCLNGNVVDIELGEVPQSAKCSATAFTTQDEETEHYGSPRNGNPITNSFPRAFSPQYRIHSKEGKDHSHPNPFEHQRQQAWNSKKGRPTPLCPVDLQIEQLKLSPTTLQRQHPQNGQNPRKPSTLQNLHQAGERKYNNITDISLSSPHLGDNSVPTSVASSPMYGSTIGRAGSLGMSVGRVASHGSAIVSIPNSQSLSPTVSHPKVAGSPMHDSTIRRAGSLGMSVGRVASHGSAIVSSPNSQSLSPTVSHPKAKRFDSNASVDTSQHTLAKRVDSNNSVDSTALTLTCEKRTPRHIHPSRFDSDASADISAFTPAKRVDSNTSVDSTALTLTCEKSPRRNGTAVVSHTQQYPEPSLSPRSKAHSPSPRYPSPVPTNGQKPMNGKFQDKDRPKSGDLARRRSVTLRPVALLPLKQLSSSLLGTEESPPPLMRKPPQCALNLAGVVGGVPPLRTPRTPQTHRLTSSLFKISNDGVRSAQGSLDFQRPREDSRETSSQVSGSTWSRCEPKRRNSYGTPKELVMVVDGNPSSAKEALDVLRNLGVTSINYTTSAAAIEHLEDPKRTMPDIMFIDVMLPDVDGFETSAKISEKFPSITLIGVKDKRYGHITPDMQRVALQVGMRHMIASPVTIEAIQGLFYGDPNTSDSISIPNSLDSTMHSILAQGSMPASPCPSSPLYGE